MDIYILRGEEQEGPYEEAAIKRQLNEGVLAPETMAWMQGMAEWQPLGELLAARRAGTMLGMIVDSLKFPLAKSAWIMIAIGAVILAVTGLVGPFAGIFALLIFIFTSGYLAAFYLKIVASSAVGDDACPDWPEFTDFWNDILNPYLRVICVGLISAAPALALAYFAYQKESTLLGLAAVALGVGGFFYYPFGIMGAVAFGNAGGALPHIVLPAIFRTLPTSLLLGLLQSIFALMPSLLSHLIPGIPLVGRVIGSAVFLYFMMAGGRLLGVYYLSKKAAFQWE